MTTPLFLHGLDSSGKGTKGTYLSERFPDILCPDFSGTLEQRLDQLDNICGDLADLVLIGSSYGGLMATRFAIANPTRVKRIVLLAPALNYENYAPPKEQLKIPALLVIGEEDTVCPPELVLPPAEHTFAELEVILADDDHLLHNTFRDLDWKSLIAGK